MEITLMGLIILTLADICLAGLGCLLAVHVFAALRAKAVFDGAVLLMAAVSAAYGAYGLGAMLLPYWTEFLT